MKKENTLKGKMRSGPVLPSHNANLWLWIHYKFIKQNLAYLQISGNLKSLFYVQPMKTLEPFNRLIIGPLKTDVTSAIMTRATNKRSSISPASFATVANIISMAPLAFKAKPMTADCFYGILPALRPSVTPSTLPIHAIERTTSTRTRSKDATKLALKPIETK